MRTMRIFLLSGLLVAMLCGSVQPQAYGRKKVVTTRPRLERLAVAPDSLRAQVDSAAMAALDSLRLSGYDKPLRSRSESLFVTNGASRRLTRLALTIAYYDMEGRELHKVEIEKGVDVPPGATRQVVFASWDKQLTFVYHRSERSSRGVKYKVKAAVVRAEWALP